MDNGPDVHVAAEAVGVGAGGGGEERGDRKGSDREAVDREPLLGEAGTAEARTTVKGGGDRGNVRGCGPLRPRMTGDAGESMAAAEVVGPSNLRLRVSPAMKTVPDKDSGANGGRATATGVRDGNGMGGGVARTGGSTRPV
jgi:hypothetical protein